MTLAQCCRGRRVMPVPFSAVIVPVERIDSRADVPRPLPRRSVRFAMEVGS
jgi:hypothetical protein